MQLACECQVLVSLSALFWSQPTPEVNIYRCFFKLVAKGACLPFGAGKSSAVFEELFHLKQLAAATENDAENCHKSSVTFFHSLMKILIKVVS